MGKKSSDKVTKQATVTPAGNSGHQLRFRKSPFLQWDASMIDKPVLISYFASSFL